VCASAPGGKARNCAAQNGCPIGNPAHGAACCSVLPPDAVSNPFAKRHISARSSILAFGDHEISRWWWYLLTRIRHWRSLLVRK
jgi:hypothetical protein